MPSNPNMTGAKLRGVLDGLGFEGVGSLLASGNLVFRTESTDAAALETRIQRALNAELGIAGGTIVREYAELRALVDSDPFHGLTHSRATYLVATFFKSAEIPTEISDFDDPLVRIVRIDPAARAILAVVDDSTGPTTAYMARLDKRYGKDITTRTWLTVQKIVKKLEQ
ncbi:DUF1697 domain-containing protein [Nocardia panacis]|uniref:DUF1697 domain-containing protein n=2 Tax=Nocardia panacis TaxID=2340916 RepID=A0A3A4KBA4_9NOCA|nr:DUF1697 domain-containing protein [Nocardia panacis]